MRGIAAKLLTGIAMTAYVLFGSDNSIGTWKRNMEKTRSSPPASSPLKSVTMIREISGNSVKVTNEGVRQDGTSINWSYTAKYDGKDYPVTGSAPFDTISMKQIDANTFTSVTKKKDGKYGTTGRIVISKDGKTYTLTTKGMNADGKPFTQIIVYDKQ